MRRIGNLLQRLRHTPSNAELQQQLRFKHDSVKAHDEKLYGDWKSADIIFADAKQRPNLVGRWDWHVWQFLIALIPAGMIYGLAQYARYDMANNPVLKQQHQKQQQASTVSGKEEERNKEELEKRLTAVESTLQTIVASLEKKSSPPSGTAVEKLTPEKAQITPPTKPPQPPPP